MKPQDEFAVIVAGVVTASTFQLLNSSGVVVAELGAPANTNGTNVTIGSALQLAHLDATAVDSQLIWSQNDPDGSAQSTFLRGPTRPAATLNPPMAGLDLSSNGSTSSNLYSGAPNGLTGPTARVSATASTATGVGQVRLDASGTLGVSGGSIVAAANGIQPVTETLDAAAGTHVVNASVSSSLQVGGSPRFTGDAGSALMRWGTVGPYVQATSSDVAMGWSGRGYMGSRTFYLPTSIQQFPIPASINPVPAYAAFILNGIAWTGTDGDVVEITTTLRVLYTAAGAPGALVAQPVVYGPGGNVVLPERLVASGWAIGEDSPISGTWRYTLALGAGAYTAVIIGGTVTGGTYAVVAPDSWMGLTNYGIR